MNSKKLILTIVAVCLFVLCINIPFNVAGQDPTQYVVNVAFPNLSFEQPVALVPEPNGNLLFVLEQAGKIRLFVNSPNVTEAGVFLDLTNKVLYGGEQGLLGLAFHPDYAENRFFYVNYVADNPRRTVIARYTTLADNPSFASVDSERVLLEINQPYNNHNGGQLAFGPEGYLYIGVGDGGSGGDPMGNGQNLSTLLGKILRIDVDSALAGREYGIPSDNPYVGNSLGYREEIYAYGFRNPWRFSFDFETGALWVADVGQNQLEEIDIVEKGKNYGWAIMEGSFCYNPSRDCNQSGLELPVWNYSRDIGYAVIGGYVYRGFTASDLFGSYVYGDYGSGKIWALRVTETTAGNILISETGLRITSFGVDQQNELYFLSYDGKIHKLAFIIPEFPSGIYLLAVVIPIILSVLILRKNKR